MHEWCGCGAGVRGRRRDVLTWRTEHRCAPQAAEDTPGQYGGGSDTTINGSQVDLYGAIGFQRNG
jgi:hypothetical protein